MSSSFTVRLATWRHKATAIKEQTCYYVWYGAYGIWHMVLTPGMLAAIILLPIRCASPHIHMQSMRRASMQEGQEGIF